MPDTLKDKIKEMEREAILIALEKCNWVKVKAARKIGITERMIGYKINKYGIEIKEVNYGEANVSSSEEADQQNNNY